MSANQAGPEAGSAEDPQHKSGVEPIFENKCFTDQLKACLTKVVTVVNPESYEDAPIGHQIRAGWYRARLIGMGQDYLILVTEYVHKGKTAVREPVKQYIPIEKIKRISLMKTERLIHL